MNKVGVCWETGFEDFDKIRLTLWIGKMPLSGTEGTVWTSIVEKPQSQRWAERQTTLSYTSLSRCCLFCGLFFFHSLSKFEPTTLFISRSISWPGKTRFSAAVKSLLSAGIPLFFTVSGVSLTIESEWALESSSVSNLKNFSSLVSFSQTFWGRSMFLFSVVFYLFVFLFPKSWIEEADLVFSATFE